MERTDGSTHKVTFIEARMEAVAEEMRRDPKVITWGEDMRSGLMGFGGASLIDEFGAHRVFDPPISENAMVGVAVGVAALGYRPIVNLCVANFATYAFDQIVNQASRVRYLFGGQAASPLTVHIGMNTALAGGAHHTDRTYPMLMNVPGLKIVTPTTPRNARGLWKAAIRDDAPVIVYDRAMLSARKEEVPDDPDFVIPIGQAEIVREGTDVTLVSVVCRDETTRAAKKLAEVGISAEVIDPLSLVPLDIDTILASVEKTGRLVIADVANDTNSAASHIAALVADRGYRYLRAPIRRVCTPDVHIPHSRPLESVVFPTPARIVREVQTLVEASDALELVVR
ncbi:alpha-ketoacid dehydrogenase subunit beta [Amycolatopsis pithecellobii]|uniref:Alpha-ketoacid dehydrogenase subunit beta n=1 Tax=Amycolatopsis pithecellobii TaxID=664692 RepID=A0A6N7Z262_9PSEU|nr:transketolase C-terminal domain-containing protein [Amycolatopsis pithecellobii]MTD55663.1 alpha-ketoacid dehydrogenase subunit beta [Amycolatopsis pithecellobii]